MSEEKKELSQQDEGSVEGYFDSLIEDFNNITDDPLNSEESDNKKDLNKENGFSKFFDDATAFGSGFQSTIDKLPDEICENNEEGKTVNFTVNDDNASDESKEIITTPVTDEDGMIVIFDEEAGINATGSDYKLNSETYSAKDSRVKDAKAEIAQKASDKSETASESADNNDTSYVTDSNIPKENEPSDDTIENTEKKHGPIRSLFPVKGDSAGEVFRKIVFLGSACVFVGAAGMLVSTIIQSKEAVANLEKLQEEITTTVATSINSQGEIVTIPPTIEKREEHNESLMDSFVKVSDDVIGFIEIDSCGISYPVVQGTDNEYYLTHTYDNRRNKAGAIFMDYRCTVSEDFTSPNIVLYGHNQEDGTMFGNLKYFKNNVEFYRNNPKVSFNTKEGIGDYVIFAYFISNVYEYQDSNGEVFHYHDYIDTLSDEATFNWYMKEVAERNQVLSPVDVQYGDQLLVLSTCSNEYFDSRFVVMARKLRECESYSDYDFSSAQLNPNARQIDWDAIYSRTSSETESSITETTTDTTTETTTTEIITTPETTETTTVSVETTAETTTVTTTETTTAETTTTETTTTVDESSVSESISISESESISQSVSESESISESISLQQAADEAAARATAYIPPHPNP